MVDKLKRKLLFSIGLGALVFLGMSVYADFEDLSGAFSRFELAYVVPALALALLNYGIRFVRWQLYIGKLDISLPKRESLVVFLAGLILSVTPGKAGELLKAYFIKERLGTPISRSAPAVVCERLTDLIALVLLALVGVSTYREGVVPLVAGGLMLVVTVAVLSRPRWMNALLDILQHLPVVGRLVVPLRLAFDGMGQLLSPAVFGLGTLLATLAWFAECFGFYLVLTGFHAEIEMVTTTFIYAFATLFGAVTMLPGGLGSTEGSMVWLLAQESVVRSDAVGATLIVRLCTLWFAVAIGAYVVLRYRRYFEWEMEPEALPGVLEGDAAAEQRRES